MLISGRVMTKCHVAIRVLISGRKKSGTALPGSGEPFGNHPRDMDLTLDGLRVTALF